MGLKLIVISSKLNKSIHRESGKGGGGGIYLVDLRPGKNISALLLPLRQPTIKDTDALMAKYTKGPVDARGRKEANRVIDHNVVRIGDSKITYLVNLHGS